MARREFSRPVAITGIGVLTSLGEGRDDNWRRLTAGESGIRRIRRFPVDNLRTTIAGTIDFLSAQTKETPLITLEAARRVVREALAQSGLGRPGDFPGPLFLAGPPIEHEWPQRRGFAERAHSTAHPAMVAAGHLLNEAHEHYLNGFIADSIAEEFGTRGAPATISTACASGATVIQLGIEAIRRGDATAALALGADASVQPEAIIRFSLLSALSTANEDPTMAAKPFSKNRDGFVMAEGAAAFVLEDAEAARSRGAKILGYVLGCGEAADGFHRTRSSPDGTPIIRCMKNALADAGLGVEDIDYVNAHGTGTPENDKMETVGLQAVFGERMNSIPVSSNKSMIGHTLTAAGLIEASFAMLTLRDQLLPPTINYREPDPAIALDVVPNQARPAKVRRILSNSFGFGGQNTSLVLGLEAA
jgi:3-oxoacyl-[acyl-carrier-protein] synthase II